MEISIFLAGVGGQGMQSVGKSFIKAADAAGLTITYSPLYTFEKRGGLSSCYVTVADGPIGSPRKEFFDVVVAMDNTTAAQYGPLTKAGGTLVINSTLVTKKPDLPDGVIVVEQPFLTQAIQIGSDKVISSVVLGFLSAYTRVIPDLEMVMNVGMAALKKKPALWEMNVKAFELGQANAEQWMNRTKDEKL